MCVLGAWEVLEYTGPGRWTQVRALSKGLKRSQHPCWVRFCRAAALGVTLDPADRPSPVLCNQIWLTSLQGRESHNTGKCHLAAVRMATVTEMKDNLVWRVWRKEYMGENGKLTQLHGIWYRGCLRKPKPSDSMYVSYF